MWKLKLKVLILLIISLSVSANPIIEKNLGQDEDNIKFSARPVNVLNGDEPLSYRLPNNTVPKSYDITIETKIHENNFEGNVKILVEIVEPTNIKITN